MHLTFLCTFRCRWFTCGPIGSDLTTTQPLTSHMHNCIFCILWRKKKKRAITNTENNRIQDSLRWNKMLAFLDTKILSANDSLQQCLFIHFKILGTAFKHQGKFIIQTCKEKNHNPTDNQEKRQLFWNILLICNITFTVEYLKTLDIMV